MRASEFLTPDSRPAQAYRSHPKPRVELLGITSFSEDTPQDRFTTFLFDPSQVRLQDPTSSRRSKLPPLWSSTPLCRYPQRIRLAVACPEVDTGAAGPTDLDIALLFVPHRIPRRVEFELRSGIGVASQASMSGPTPLSGPHLSRRQKKKKHNRRLKSTIQHRISEPSTITDVAHTVSFEINVPRMGLDWFLEILLHPALDQDQIETNCFMQVAIQSLSIGLRSQWDDDLRNSLETLPNDGGPLCRSPDSRSLEITFEQIEDEIETNYRRMDEYTKRRMGSLIEKKLLMIQEENYLGLETLRENQLERLREIGEALRTLEMTKRKAIVRKKFKEANDLQTEIYEMRKDVDAIISGTIASRLREKAAALPASTRNAKLLARQQKVLHGVINTLEEGLEGERDYFPSRASRIDLQINQFFKRIMEFGFGETESTTDEVIQKSVPASLWFKRTAAFGFGFGCGRFTGLDRDPSRFIQASERPATGAYLNRMMFDGLGEEPRVRTTESQRYVNDMMADGFGEERVNTTESQAYFRGMGQAGFGSQPSSRASTSYRFAPSSSSAPVPRDPGVGEEQRRTGSGRKSRGSSRATSSRYRSPKSTDGYFGSVERRGMGSQRRH